MHAGTQTLIQALQAIPWTNDPDNDDDIINHDLTPADSESDEDIPGSQYSLFRNTAADDDYFRQRSNMHLQYTLSIVPLLVLDVQTFLRRLPLMFHLLHLLSISSPAFH
jgi:hypothetical protein